MKNQLLAYGSAAMLIFGGMFLLLAKHYLGGGLIIAAGIGSIILNAKLNK